MANDTLLNTPVLWINKYIQNKIISNTGIGVPLFPSSPNTINDLTETLISITTTDVNGNQLDQRYPYAGVMLTWDRLARMNKNVLPHIKTEQVLYYIYATEVNVWESLIQVQENILRLMDRADETAQEVNDWCSNRRVNIGTELIPNLIDNMFFFHSFKVYQLQESRDIVDFGTARTYGGNKFIIEYQYHQMPDLTENTWHPEPKLTGSNKISI